MVPIVVIQGAGSISVDTLGLWAFGCVLICGVLALAGVVCEIPIVKRLLDWMWHSVVGVQDWWRE